MSSEIYLSDIIHRVSIQLSQVYRQNLPIMQRPPHEVMWNRTSSAEPDRTTDKDSTALHDGYTSLG